MTQTSVPCIPRSRPITAPATTMCHARYLARKAVKQQMQAAGFKISHVEARVIHMKAHAYLDRHRDELVAEATVTIDSGLGAVTTTRETIMVLQDWASQTVDIQTGANRTSFEGDGATLLIATTARLNKWT